MNNIWQFIKAKSPWKNPKDIILVTLGGAFILILVFYSSGFLKTKREARNEVVSIGGQHDAIGAVIKENNDWVGADKPRLEASSLLPQGVFLRELNLLPGKGDTYLGIYIDKFTININGTDEKLSDLYITCPEEVSGAVSITGEYHLFVLKNNKIFSDSLIPISEREKQQNSTSTIIELVLKNTKRNDNYLFGGLEPTEENRNDIIRINLMRFSDYTGDSFPYEFNLVSDSGPCGHNDYLIAGYNKLDDKAIIYPIIGKNNKISYWHDNFKPKGAAVDYNWYCDDHSANFGIHEIYKFDNKLNGYKLSSSSTRACSGPFYTP